MKTQVNILEAERRLTNKVMTVFLIVIGCIILYASVTNILNQTFSKKINSYEMVNPNNGLAKMDFVEDKK